jgi:L-iditol 2-dehydrogenase
MEAPDLGRAVALVASGRVALHGLVTHRFALDDAPAAFEHLARRAGLKIVVEPGGRA